eukprot:52829-Prymnesium_polylepis.1
MNQARTRAWSAVIQNRVRAYAICGITLSTTTLSRSAMRWRWTSSRCRPPAPVARALRLPSRAVAVSDARA